MNIHPGIRGGKIKRQTRPIDYPLRESVVMRHQIKNPNTSASLIASTPKKTGLSTEFLALKKQVARKRQLEERLRHAQKMEAVGQLAGGVAHDFNNILMAILMGLGMLREKPELSLETKESLKEIEKETARGANLTRQLLLFSRQESAKFEPLDVNQLINNLLIMLRRLLGENIEISFQGSLDPIWINADAGMMEQVVLNLCLNARDAMPEGGRLTITASLADVARHSDKSNISGRSSRFIRLSISDTGCGMEETVLRRIFEPFFTTKEMGKGTGLGLATVYGIVQQHQGWVEVDSVVGRGSSFRVFLPEAMQRYEAPLSHPILKAEGGSETILLVEDDLAVRRLVAAWLRKLGYTVLEAGNCSEATEIWNKKRKEIELLFTDMLMPGSLTGLDLALRLKKDEPSLKIISSSGYDATATKPALPPGDEITYLPKPYAPEALAATVRHCLDKS